MRHNALSTSNLCNRKHSKIAVFVSGIFLSLFAHALETETETETDATAKVDGLSIRLEYKTEFQPNPLQTFRFDSIYDISESAVRHETLSGSQIGNKKSYRHRVSVNRLDSQTSGTYDIEHDRLDEPTWQKVRTKLDTNGTFGPDLKESINKTEAGLSRSDLLIPCTMDENPLIRTTVCVGEINTDPVIVWSQSTIPSGLMTTNLVGLSTDVVFPEYHFELPQDRLPTPVLKK